MRYAHLRILESPLATRAFRWRIVFSIAGNCLLIMSEGLEKSLPRNPIKSKTKNDPQTPLTPSLIIQLIVTEAS